VSCGRCGELLYAALFGLCGCEKRFCLGEFRGVRGPLLVPLSDFLGLSGAKLAEVLHPGFGCGTGSFLRCAGSFHRVGHGGLGLLGILASHSVSPFCVVPLGVAARRRCASPRKG
jgi:hypothetical protein